MLPKPHALLVVFCIPFCILLYAWWLAPPNFDCVTPTVYCCHKGKIIETKVIVGGTGCGFLMYIWELCRFCRHFRLGDVLSIEYKEKVRVLMCNLDSQYCLSLLQGLYMAIALFAPTLV